MTFPWFSSDLVSESLESPSPVGSVLQKCLGGQKSLPAPGEQNRPVGQQSSFVSKRRPSFSLGTLGVKGKSMGVTVGPLLQAQLQCHRKNAERKSNFQRVRTIHSVTLSGVISSRRAKEYSIFLSLWLKSGQWRCRFEAR